MEVCFATPADEARWNEFVLAHSRGNFLQSWEWGEAQRLLEHDFWRLVVQDGDTWLAAALVVKRDLPMGRAWLYIPRGPVLRDNINSEAWITLQDKLAELGTQEKAIFVRMDPAWQESAGLERWQKAERQVQPQHTLVLDITKSEEELLAAMHPKTRYNIRLAGRREVTVRFSASLDPIDIFLKLSREVSGRSGFSYHPDNYYRALLSALAPHGMLELAIAEYKGEPLAAHIMVYAGDVATYVHGASSQKHRSVMAPQLTYWETILRAKDKGKQLYDFFGVAPEGAAKNHPWTGITRIKEGFGGRRISYIGAYDLVLDENFYTIVNTIRRVKQLWR